MNEFPSSGGKRLHYQEKVERFNPISAYQNDGINGQSIWYYDKATGLWVAAAWVEWDNNENGINNVIDNVIDNWGGHLTSTNVTIGNK